MTAITIVMRILEGSTNNCDLSYLGGGLSCFVSQERGRTAEKNKITEDQMSVNVNKP